MNLIACISYLYSDAQAGVDFDLIDRGDGPEILYWNLDAPQPTLEQLEAVEAEAQAAWALKEVHAQRLAAYRSESDPLKIEADYDAQVNGTPPDYTAWVAKVQEIKARYPLP